MERPLLRVQTIRSDTQKQVSEHYRQVVQLQEQLSDNEWQLQFCRGVVNALEQMETILTEGDLPQALMRLQNLRVSIYCDLSLNFEAKTLLKRDLDNVTKDLHFYRGICSVKSDALTELTELSKCYETVATLTDKVALNENELHFRRGGIAGLDEAERIINEELNPKQVPARYPQSPGAVGPDFVGQAMKKPDAVKFTSYDDVEPLPDYPEYHPGSLQMATIDDGRIS